MQLGHYLIATWAKVCQAMGPKFERYLPVVMPSLLMIAGTKADPSLYRAFTPLYQVLFIHPHSDKEDVEKAEERDGWETVILDRQTYSVCTPIMDKKCQAFETLVIYCSTLGVRFSPFLAQTLEVTPPCLRFYFHERMRESCAVYAHRPPFEM